MRICFSHNLTSFGHLFLGFFTQTNLISSQIICASLTVFTSLYFTVSMRILTKQLHTCLSFNCDNAFFEMRILSAFLLRKVIFLKSQQMRFGTYKSMDHNLYLCLFVFIILITIHNFWNREITTRYTGFIWGISQYFITHIWLTYNIFAQR